MISEKLPLFPQPECPSGHKAKKVCLFAQCDAPFICSECKDIEEYHCHQGDFKIVCCLWKKFQNDIAGWLASQRAAPTESIQSENEKTLIHYKTIFNGCLKTYREAKRQVDTQKNISAQNIEVQSMVAKLQQRQFAAIRGADLIRLENQLAKLKEENIKSPHELQQLCGQFEAMVNQYTTRFQQWRNKVIKHSALHSSQAQFSVVIEEISHKKSSSNTTQPENIQRQKQVQAGVQKSTPTKCKPRAKLSIRSSSPGVMQQQICSDSVEVLQTKLEVQNIEVNKLQKYNQSPHERLEREKICKLFNKQQYVHAISIGENFIKNYGSSNHLPQIYRIVGESNKYIGEKRKAILNLNKGYQIDNQHIPILLALANYYYENGNHDKTKRYLEKVKELDSEESQYFYLLAMIQQHEGHHTTADKLYRKTLEIDPSFKYKQGYNDFLQKTKFRLHW